MLLFRRTPPRSDSNTASRDEDSISTRTRTHERSNSTYRSFAPRAAALAAVLVLTLLLGNERWAQQQALQTLLFPNLSRDSTVRDLQHHHASKSTNNKKNRHEYINKKKKYYPVFSLLRHGPQHRHDDQKQQAALASQEWEMLRQIHMAKHPAIHAGEWIHQDEVATRYPQNFSTSDAESFFVNTEKRRTMQHYLRCLNKEVQGHCHQRPLSGTNFSRPGPSRQKFHKDYGKDRCCIDNSPGILNATDPYVWKPRHPDLYGILDYSILDDAQIINKVLRRSKIFMLGDSVMRQWHQSMFCEIKFFLQDNQAHEKVKFFSYYRAPLEWANVTIQLDSFLEHVTAKDYVVFNIGHHFTPYQNMNEYWRDAYARNLKAWIRRFHSLVQERGMDPRRIIFRTTNSRAFHAKKGDYYTPTAIIGGTEPNALAQWKEYGGYFQGQPHQNLMAMETVLKEGFSVLDISPMTLSRADATYDGTHLCLPGLHESWSEMLFYKLAVMEGFLPQNGKVRKQSKK